MEGNTRKLARLRARTDRQLVELISARLDRGFALASGLAGSIGQTDWAKQKDLQQCAEEAWSEAARLLSALDSSAAPERTALECRAGILREMLDQLAADVFPIKKAACF